MNLYSQGTITKFHWIVLPHSPHSSDITRDLYLFKPLKNVICGMRYANNFEVTAEVSELLH